MKKTFVLLTLVAILLMASPVSAIGPTYVGDRIFANADGQSYPADTPFYISHGWGGNLGVDPLGFEAKASFTLEVDGELISEDFVDRFVDHDSSYLLKLYVFNFYEGLSAGEHTFTGHYYVACKYTGSECEKSNKLIEVFTVSATVDFTP